MSERRSRDTTSQSQQEALTEEFEQSNTKPKQQDSPLKTTKNKKNKVCNALYNLFVLYQFLVGLDSARTYLALISCVRKTTLLNPVCKFDVFYGQPYCYFNVWFWLGRVIFHVIGIEILPFEIDDDPAWCAYHSQLVFYLCLFFFLKANLYKYIPKDTYNSIRNHAIVAISYLIFFDVMYVLTKAVTQIRQEISKELKLGLMRN